MRQKMRKLRNVNMVINSLHNIRKKGKLSCFEITFNIA